MLWREHAVSVRHRDLAAASGALASWACCVAKLGDGYPLRIVRSQAYDSKQALCKLVLVKIRRN